MKIAIWLARVLVAGVFLYAGVLKLGASERFTITVAKFGLLPELWANAVAIALPWLETLTGILLLIPRTARIGAFAAAALLILFLAALAWAWSQGFTIDCGCFGVEDEQVPGNAIPLALARDVVLLAITLLLAARRA
jgi:uncharacterized membrane protein YphA (DoxX/SURF4 family)